VNVGNARADQRRSRRFRQQVEVDVIDRHGTRRGRAIDVARHGLFVAVVDPPHNRHLVQLVLHLPDGPLQASATVSRTLPGQGVGLSLFSLSSDAKRRWDAFIIRAQQTIESAPALTPPSSQPGPLSHPSHPSPPTTPALSSGAVPVHGPDMPSFVVKLKTMERLRDYMQTHVAVGGTVLFTPVLPIAGTLLQLLVVHPVSEAEFALLGRV